MGMDESWRSKSRTSEIRNGDHMLYNKMTGLHLKQHDFDQYLNFFKKKNSRYSEQKMEKVGGKKVGVGHSVEWVTSLEVVVQRVY